MTITDTRPPLASASLDLLDRAYAALGEAITATSPADRYVAAHLAGLRAAAALLATRGRPTAKGRPRSVWELLPPAAPELTEWAAFYTASARRRAVAERGGPVPVRAADDLVRASETFLGLVESSLGVAPHAPLPSLQVATGVC
ncbi:SAV_6107 family HEPN domain-containing protein [Arsenicicoccus dermatophilus]|uniref:SAV_6107 family HEPN domain-containing protein n=1 Tax=Arsenicicoccus dermatophilus TaxID=1076331 RepID=UPI0039172587